MEAVMQPLNFLTSTLFDEIYHEHWGILPRRDRWRIDGNDVPVRPRLHPLQRLFTLPR